MKIIKYKSIWQLCKEFHSISTKCKTEIKISWEIILSPKDYNKIQTILDSKLLKNRLAFKINFENKVIFKGKFKRVSLTNFNFFQTCSFYWEVDNLEITNCQFKDDLDWLDIKHFCSNINKLIISWSRLKELQILHWTNISYLYITSSKIDHINLYWIQNEIEIIIYKVDGWIINLNHINKISRLEISSDINWGKKDEPNSLIIKDSSFTKNSSTRISNINWLFLHLENVWNLSDNFTIESSEIEIFELKTTNLWKAVLNNLEIKSLYINWWFIANSYINSVSFPKEISISKKSKISVIRMKDNYRQLKHLMDKNWNYTQANKFYALEMNEELKNTFKNFSWKELRKNLKNKDYFSWTFSNLSNLISLLFNKLFSNFWTNWILSVFWLITLAFFGSIWMFYYSLDNIWGFWNTVNSLENWYLESWIIFPIVFIFLVFLFIYLLNKFTNKAPIISSMIYFWILYFFHSPKLLLDFTQLLINPFYLLDFNWVESSFVVVMIGLYKILYWTIIYQMITTIRRTTKR